MWEGKRVCIVGDRKKAAQRKTQHTKQPTVRVAVLSLGVEGAAATAIIAEVLRLDVAARHFIAVGVAAVNTLKERAACLHSALHNTVSAEVVCCIARQTCVLERVRSRGGEGGGILD